MATTKITSDGVVTVAGGSNVLIQGAVTLDTPTFGTPRITGVANVDAVGMSPTTLTTSTAITRGGLYYVTGDTVTTVTLPAAANVPGQSFIFRSTSAQAHVVTASAETNGTLAIVGFPGMAEASLELNGHGSKLTLTAVQNSSVMLVCDGVNFLVSAASGSHAIAGT